jgi:hypothetical protein
MRVFSEKSFKKVYSKKGARGDREKPDSLRSDILTVAFSACVLICGSNLLLQQLYIQHLYRYLLI